jgi:CheY-like chemotaxis protein
MGLFAAALSARSHDARVCHLVSSINASVEALERLFSALMDISKLDAGAIAPRRTAFALAPMLERLEREFAPLASAKGLRLAVVPTRAWVESDPMLLERILANLASNAVRYTERGGVVLGARRCAGRIALEAWDSGVGIAPAERERIFEEFYQVAGQPRTAASKGMGLGLAIIRRLATLLGHPLRLRSEPGKGSRFSIEVPRAAPIAAASVATSGIAAAPAAPLAGVRIAVVDDEAIVLEGMHALLGTWGATVIGATSCDALLSALGEALAYPDLVIADYRVGRDELGTEVVARLRHELGVAVPALLISGDSSAETLDTLRCSGLDFLLKPVLPEELKAHVLRLCASDFRRVRVRTAEEPTPVAAGA